MATSTIPTVLTQLQYDNAVFAVNRDNADHFLLYGNVGEEFNLKNSLWVGRDENSLNNTNPEDVPSYEVVGVDVIDENGNTVEIEAITYSTKDAFNTLDLELLAEGKLSWR